MQNVFFLLLILVTVTPTSTWFYSWSGKDATTIAPSLPVIPNHVTCTQFGNFVSDLAIRRFLTRFPEIELPDWGNFFISLSNASLIGVNTVQRSCPVKVGRVQQWTVNSTEKKEPITLEASICLKVPHIRLEGNLDIRSLFGIMIPHVINLTINNAQIYGAIEAKLKRGSRAKIVDLQITNLKEVNLEARGLYTLIASATSWLINTQVKDSLIEYVEKEVKKLIQNLLRDNLL